MEPTVKEAITKILIGGQKSWKIYPKDMDDIVPLIKEVMCKLVEDEHIQILLAESLKFAYEEGRSKFNYTLGVHSSVITIALQNRIRRIE